MTLRNIVNRITWALFKRESVGVDVHGNRYVRMLDRAPDGAVFERRLVRYKDSSMLDPTTLPPEWLQWLHKTRSLPPTANDIVSGQRERDVQKERARDADIAEAEKAQRFKHAGSRNDKLFPKHFIK